MAAGLTTTIIPPELFIENEGTPNTVDLEVSRLIFTALLLQLSLLWYIAIKIPFCAWATNITKLTEYLLKIKFQHIFLFIFHLISTYFS